VKTSLNDLSTPDPNAPLILLMVRGLDGQWSNHVFGRVADKHTRPIVLIDQEHRDLYVVATAPTGGGAIYYKKTSLSKISFPTGRGTPFIQSATDPQIDDATSTKQSLNSTTDLLVLASDSDSSRFYLHNTIDLPQGCTISGTSADETLTGTSGNDIICGLGGNDTIKGLTGDDVLAGDTGNDKLVGGTGNDTLDGSLGTDTADYAGSKTAITASLESNSATGVGADTLADIENLIGSSLADDLSGSGAANTLKGGGGDDTLRGDAGNDTVVGSGGADDLFGDGGTDKLNSKDGVSGNDSLDGGTGTDTAVTDATEASIVGIP
jgi:Ca2+-binding RTX toxin-like protein